MKPEELLQAMLEDREVTFDSPEHGTPKICKVFYVGKDRSKLVNPQPFNITLPNEDIVEIKDEKQSKNTGPADM